MAVEGRPPSWRLAAAATAVLLVAALLRLASLATMPFGMHVDEALNVIDERTISWSNHPVFFPAKGGREALFFYWQNLFVIGLGASTLSVRLASAFLGIATVAAEVAVMRRFFGWRVGLLAGGVLGTFFWPVAQSRVGLRTVALPLAVLLVLLLLRRATACKSARLLAIAGAAVGMSVYVYTAARALPLVVAGYLVFALATHPRSWRTWVTGGLGAAAACLVVLIPMALYVRDHPAAFVQRLGETSALDASRSSDARAVGENLVAYARSVGGVGDIQGFINIPGRPMFNPAGAGLVFVGLALLLAFAVAPLGARRRLPREWDRDAAWLCLLSLVAMLLPGLLSQGAPYFPRITGVLPALAVAPALALDLVIARAGRTRLLGAATVAAGVLLAAQAGETAHDYFGAWAHSPDRAFGNSSGATAFGLHLASQSRGGELFVSTYEPEIPEALAPGASARATWFQARQWLPIPRADSGPATFYFIRNDPRLDPPLLERMLSAHARATFTASDPVMGVEVARGYTVQPAALDALLPSGPTAAFGGRLQVTGASIYGDPAEPGSYQIVLGIRAVRDAPGYVSISVRAVDGAGSVWGQVDGLGDDPSRWRAGQETLVDMPLHLTPGTPPGRLDLEARVYELTTLAAVPADGPRPSLTLGTIDLQKTVPEREGLAYPPLDRSDVKLGDAVQVEGVRLEPAAPLQGQTARLDILWRCLAPGVGATLDVTLVDQAGAALGRFQAGDGLAAPTPARCAPGETVLDRRYLPIGPRWPPGRVTIAASLGAGETAGVAPTQLLATTLTPLARDPSAPPLAAPIGASFADGVRLLGIAGSPGATAGQGLISLVWQATSPPLGNYTVFVHLLGADGAVTAQHDGPPADGAWPTTYWQAGQVVVDEHLLAGSGSNRLTGARLEIGMYDPASGRRLHVVDPGSAAVADDAVRLPMPAR